MHTDRNSTDFVWRGAAVSDDEHKDLATLGDCSMPVRHLRVYVSQYGNGAADHTYIHTLRRSEEIYKQSIIHWIHGLIRSPSESWTILTRLGNAQHKPSTSKLLLMSATMSFKRRVYCWRVSFCALAGVVRVSLWRIQLTAVS